MTGQAEGVGGPDASTKLSLERTRLAYDRTMLAWMRIATALITFGFSIEESFRIAKAGAPQSKDLVGPQEFGLLMISIGSVAPPLATLENRSAMQALAGQYPAKEGYSEVPRSRAVMLAALIAVLGLLCLFSIMVRK